MNITKDQRYEALRDVKVLVLTHWRAPFTGGNEAICPQGEVVVVVSDPVPWASAATCRPERYEERLPHFVIESDRRGPKFDGYSLVIDKGLLSAAFKLLPA